MRVLRRRPGYWKKLDDLSFGVLVGWAVSVFFPLNLLRCEGFLRFLVLNTWVSSLFFLGSLKLKNKKEKREKINEVWCERCQCIVRSADIFCFRF